MKLQLNIDCMCMYSIIQLNLIVHPLGRVKWQYREVTMVSTGVKHIDECRVRKKLSGHCGFDITVGWQCAEVELQSVFLVASQWSIYLYSVINNAVLKIAERKKQTIFFLNSFGRTRVPKLSGLKCQQQITKMEDKR